MASMYKSKAHTYICYKYSISTMTCPFLKSTFFYLLKYLRLFFFSPLFSISLTFYLFHLKSCLNEEKKFTSCKELSYKKRITAKTCPNQKRRRVDMITTFKFLNCLDTVDIWQFFEVGRKGHTREVRDDEKKYFLRIRILNKCNKWRNSEWREH